VPGSLVESNLFAPIGPYSHAVKAGGQVFISGTPGVDVHVQVNMVEVAEFSEMNRAYAEMFSEPYPARTVIGIAALPKPGARLTMNVIAVLKD